MSASNVFWIRSKGGSITSWSLQESESCRPDARGLRRRSEPTTSGAGCRFAKSPNGLTRS